MATYKNARTVVISQNVVNPIGNECNTDVGNPAALRVPANESRVFDQNVVHPSFDAKRCTADQVKGS